MKNPKNSETPTFLNSEKEDFEESIIKLNVYLNETDEKKKPYKIDYQTLLMSYKRWNGKDLDEFCYRQTISNFLLNPNNDSNVAKEAFFIEIREFLSNK